MTAILLVAALLGQEDPTLQEGFDLVLFPSLQTF
mgnify:CR=1 FL=1|jgi:hypothetical protein